MSKGSLACLLLVLFVVPLSLSAAETPSVPREDPRLRPVAFHNGTLQVDYPALVGHNDVVYLTPALYPFEALPLGNGNLGVTLWNQGGMYYKLNNGSFWRFEGQTTAQCSAGEAQLAMPGCFEAATDFKERLSLYEGVVYTRAVTPAGEVLVTSFVVKDEDLVVVHVQDRRSGPVVRHLTLSHWRDDVTFSRADGIVSMTSSSGTPATAPITGLPQPTTSVLAACVEGLPVRPGAQGERRLGLELNGAGPAEYTVYLAAPAVREGQGDALAYTRERLAKARQRGWQELLRENERAWAEFWGRSALYLTGEDATAEYFAQLWHLNLYWAGCQSRGPYCPKFNGGNLLIEKDERPWGGMYWYQNTREMFWDLPAMNHPELVQPLFDLYRSLVPASRQNAQNIFKVGGLNVQETSDQNGLASGAPLKLLILTNGLESAFEFYNWCRYTGDQTLLQEKVYPYLKEAVQFFLEYAKRGEDGKWHLYPSNARETWLKVQDAAPDLCGLRVCVPLLLHEARRLGRDADLIPAWQDLLDNLAELPVDAETGVYMPCVFRPDSPATGLPVVDRMYGKPANVSHSATERKNSEVPECEILYPWGLAGIGTDNFERAKRTFLGRRIAPVGWDPSGIWAARLGLADEALRALLAHSGNQRWPQGWWNSPAGSRWGKAIPASPFFDSAGVNAATLTEMCLQSYDGKVRLWPAFPVHWSGLLRLRALPGFMVTSEIAAGRVRYVVIESERGEECKLVVPWSGRTRVSGRDGYRWESGEPVLAFDTRRGGRYLVEPVAVPLSGRPWAELKPARSEGPRWPGQTSPQQQWRPGQPIMIGLAKDGHPLRVRVEAAAAAAPPQP